MVLSQSVVKLEPSFQAPTASGSSGEFVSVVRQAIAQQKQQVMQTAVELEHVKNEVESFSVEFYNLQEENLRLEAAVQTHGEQERLIIFLLVPCLLLSNVCLLSDSES